MRLRTANNKRRAAEKKTKARRHRALKAMRYAAMYGMGTQKLVAAYRSFEFGTAEAAEAVRQFGRVVRKAQRDIRRRKAR